MPSSMRISPNSRRIVSRRLFEGGTGGVAGFGSGRGGAPASAGGVNSRRRLNEPSVDRSTSTRGRRKPAFTATARVGQSKSMPTSSMRSTRIAGREAPGSRISTFCAQLLPLDCATSLPSRNAMRFRLSPK